MMYRWRPLGTARLRWRVDQTWTTDRSQQGSIDRGAGVPVAAAVAVWIEGLKVGYNLGLPGREPCGRTCRRSRL
jgi:hypothetical protein